MDNLERLKLYEIHVFKYSVREGTLAQKMTGQVAEQIKGERSDRLLELTKKQKKEYKISLKGYVDEVLVEERVDGEKKLEELWDAKILKTEENAGKTGQNKQKKLQYFTGHTKRYVKVRIASKDNMVNQIVRVEML